MRKILLAALVTLAVGSPAHAGSFLRLKQTIRRDYLRTKATLGNKAMETMGLIEMLGYRIKVKPYEAKVSSALWRGSRLSADGLRDLKRRGFGMVVGLTAERDLDKPALDIGLPHERIPILDNHTPTLGQVSQFLDIIRTQRAAAAARGEAPKPVYVHCEAGIGRTGIMVAAYRMKFDGWSTAQAVVEARKYGMQEREQIEFIRSLGSVIHSL